MLKTTLSVIAATVMIAASVGAQTKPPKPAAAAPSEAPAEQTPKPAVAEAPAPRPEPQGQPVNVRLELTIADQMGPGEPTKKVITMIVADRQNGFIRSKATVKDATSPNTWTYRELTINVDARPTILRDGNIRVDLGLEYQPTRPAGAPASAGTDPGMSNLNERISMIVEPGKPLTISQAADPTSDRRITVELKATILK